MRPCSLRARRMLLGSLTSVAVLTTGLVTPPQPAAAAPGNDPACPAAYPADDLALGQVVTGATTAGSYRRGGVEFDSRTTPEPFTGFFRGTLEDPAGDLLVFELEGSRITRADGSVDAGAWSGISGSPLYAADGRLVGSVSYSFTSTQASVFAGVTPAEDLYGLLAETGTAPPAARVTPSRAEARELVRQGMPSPTATTGAVRLGPDLQLSGLGSRLSSRTLRAIATKSGRPVPRVAGGGGTQSENIAIVPGGNVAVSDSYGSLALYSVGTAAAVCDGVVIGYGHSADWAPFSRTIHGASTAIIADDGAYSFKLANLGAPQGSLLHDRTHGITGRLGPLPTTASVSVASAGPRPRTTTTRVSNQDALSFIVASQAYRDAALTLDELAGGRAEVAWTISYRRENGKKATFQRSQRYASPLSIPDEVTSDVAGDIDTLLGNEFEKITITDVAVRQQVTRGYQAYQLGTIEVARKGRWKRVADRGAIKLVPGRTLRIRVNLKRAHGAYGTPAISKVFKLAVPQRALRAKVKIATHGASFWDDLESFGIEDEELASLLGEGGEGPVIASFEELVQQLRSQPRQDRLDLRLKLLTSSGRSRTRTATWTVPSVVNGSHVMKLKAARP